jgi:hypothetical protein
MNSTSATVSGDWDDNISQNITCDGAVSKVTVFPLSQCINVYNRSMSFSCDEDFVYHRHYEDRDCHNISFLTTNALQLGCNQNGTNSIGMYCTTNSRLPLPTDELFSVIG